MRTSFHHQPEAQHPNFPLSVSWQADYPIFGSFSSDRHGHAARGLSACAPKVEMRDLSRHVGFVKCSKWKSPFDQFGGDLLRQISGGSSPKPGLMAGFSRCTRLPRKEKPWLVESLPLSQPLLWAFRALLLTPQQLASSKLRKTLSSSLT